MKSSVENVSEASNVAAPIMSLGSVGWLITLSVLMNTLAGVFSDEKTLFLYKDALHLSASGVATLGIITGIPAYLRPFMGAGSDIFPLFGFHRRSYYACSWLLMALGYAALALIHAFHYNPVVCLLIVTGAGGNLLFVIMDAVMVSVGNRFGAVGRLQTIQQGVPLLLGVTFAGPLSGYVTQHWSYGACFGATALCAALAAPLALLIKEPRKTSTVQTGESSEERAARLAEHRAERAQVLATLRQAASSPGLWAIVGFVFYLIVTPGTNYAQFYYSVDVLHFSKQFLGNLGIPNSAGSILGVLLFAAASRKLPVRAMVWGAYLMDCSLYLTSMGLHDKPSAIVVNFVLSFFGTIYDLCLLTLAARACPPGIEGAVYGLVIAATGLAGTLGEKLGSNMYVYFGPAHHHSTAHGWFSLLWFGFVFTVFAAVFIPFLPAWTRSNEPLHPKQPTTDDAGTMAESL